jgi:O-antigen ligase
MKVHNLIKETSTLDFTYYAFMASIPIEILGTAYFEWPVSLSLLTGLIFVFLFFILLKREALIFRLPPLIMLPIIWLTFAFGNELLSDEIESIAVLTGIFNNLIFSVILYNYLLKKPAGIKNGLFVMGLSTGLSGIILISIFGLDMLRGERFSILDFDENNLASIFGLGVIILSFYLQAAMSSFKMLVFLLPLTFASILIVVATGSRGSMLALTLALLFYIFFVETRKLLRLKNIIFIAALMAVIVITFLESPTAQLRWQLTFEGEEGTAFADRDKITRVVLSMIAEKPMLGWGVSAGVKEAGYEMAKEGAGSHNTYLMIILTSGFIGGIPMLYYIFYPLFKWKINKKNEQYKRLCVMLFFTLIIFLSLDMLNRKQYWIITTMLLATMVRPTEPEEARFVEITNG